MTLLAPEIEKEIVDVELLPMLQTLRRMYNHLELLTDKVTVAEKQINLLELFPNEEKLNTLSFTAENLENFFL